MARTGTMATVSCVECGSHRQPGELWRLYFADLGEVVVYCPECAEREFGASAADLDTTSTEE